MVYIRAVLQERASLVKEAVVGWFQEIYRLPTICDIMFEPLQLSFELVSLMFYVEVNVNAAAFSMIKILPV